MGIIRVIVGIGGIVLIAWGAIAIAMNSMDMEKDWLSSGIVAIVIGAVIVVIAIPWRRIMKL